MKACAICLIFLLSTVPLVQSKCANVIYTIKGKVVDEGSEPVAKVRVALFLDNGFRPAKTCKTDDNGFYECELIYYPIKYSFFLVGEKCSAIHKKMEIFVYHEDYEAKRILLQDNKKFIKKEIDSIERDKRYTSPITIVVKDIQLIKILVEGE